MGSLYDILSSLGFEPNVVFLQNEAAQQDVSLPKDAARYIAQNAQSDTRELRSALTRLIAHSMLTGSRITLDYAKRVLGKYFELQGSKSTVDPFQGIFSGQQENQQGTGTRRHSATVDSAVLFSLRETRQTQKITRVRQHLEVNMRELERERLARFDVYERTLEIRAIKRKLR